MQSPLSRRHIRPIQHAISASETGVVPLIGGSTSSTEVVVTVGGSWGRV
jgi:hypothetical protein